MPVKSYDFSQPVPELPQERVLRLIDETEQALLDWEVALAVQIGDEDLRINMGDSPEGEGEPTDLVFLDPDTREMTIQELQGASSMTDLEGEAGVVSELCIEHRLEILQAVQEMVTDRRNQ